MDPDGVALFNEANLAPGDVVARKITLINNDTRYDCPLTLTLKNTAQTPADFAAKLLTEIKNGGITFYGGEGETLNDLYNAGAVFLGNIPADRSVVFDWIVAFDREADDSYQGAETVFDFDLVFECGEAEKENGDSDSGNVAIGGGLSSSSPSPAGWAPFVFEGGGVFGEILGAVNKEILPEELPSSTFSAEVKGRAVCPWWAYLWWLVLAVQAFLTGFYYYLSKDKASAGWWLLPLVLACLSQFLHELFGCECVKSSLCPWHWLFNLIIFSTFSYWYWRHKKKQEEQL